MIEKKTFFLDMDGVICDLSLGLIKLLNKKYHKSLTIEEYALKCGKYKVEEYYELTNKDFFEIIKKDDNFWLDLPVTSYGHELYKNLCNIAKEVIIVTKPVYDYKCAAQKLEWLNYHFNIKSDKVFIGAKKYLMAGNGILVDDYEKNINEFKENNGDAILIPSSWNTPNLKFDIVWESLIKELNFIEEWNKFDFSNFNDPLTKPIIL